ncbi:STAS domain-containing protein [Gracilibacillus caseinilyticus]|uniref:STAS domain-containing protein n=1 Tax=Gracilibacillus caseinilyticus TaxID=2932256 RepID=A0ABY4ES31_9BACI|nr:STAS domain-containing protein [Gracilibacillus caseinilyticus]UOQ47243.1 STAS domain-containing protein [Gracilibacillus caseinilyticus]
MTPLEKENLASISQKILNEKDKLVNELPVPKLNGVDITKDLIQWRKELLDVYAESIVSNIHIPINELEGWGVEVSNRLLDLMLPLDLVLEEISNYRETIGEIIHQEAVETEFTLDAYHKAIVNFNYIVDQAVKIVSNHYMQDYNDTIAKARYAVDELSIPLVKITEQIGIIPIIGEIDTHRADQLMKNALNQGNSNDLDYIIMDLSGVSAIDTMVAQQLFKVIESLELIGIHPLLSGIRPDIVQTMVSLGINMRHIDTFSSLHRALATIHSLDAK